MKKLYFLLVFLAGHSLEAQRFDWVKFVSSATTDTSVNGAYDMVRDENGNLYTVSTFATDIMVGDELETHYGAYNNQNIVIIKWNAAGEIVAFKKVVAQETGLFPHHLAYDQTNQQLILSTDVLGQPLVIPDDDISLTDNDTAVQILRFDSNLEYVSNIPKYYTYNCPLATYDGFTYFAHGYSSSVFKVNAQNQVQWSLAPQGSGAFSIANLTCADDGTLYLTARVTWQNSITLGTVTVNVPAGNNDQLVLFKIASNGTVLAGTYLTRSTSFNTRIPVAADSENVFVMAGYSQPNLTIGEFPLSDPIGGNDAFVVKLNADLEPVWVTEFHNSAGNLQTNALSLSPSGHLIAVGNYTQDGTFGPFPLSFSSGGTGFLAKMDWTNGNVVYATEMGSLANGSTARAVVPTDDSFYVAGFSTAITDGLSTYGCYKNGMPGLFLTKITDVAFSQPQISVSFANGTLTALATASATYQWLFNGEPIDGATQSSYVPTENGDYTVVAQFDYGCTDAGQFEVTSLALATFDRENVRIYPNPTQNVVNIASEFPVDFVSISDLTGKIVLSEKPQNTTIDFSQLSSGMYLMAIESNGKRIQHKIIKQ